MYCKHYYRIHLYVLLVYNQAFLKAYLVMYRAKSVKACPFGSGLKKFALDPVVVIFSNNVKKVASVGQIQSL